jgi:hypothetical protein
MPSEQCERVVMVNDVQPRVRRREIVQADLPGVVDALVRGFPGRDRGHWERGLRRMGERPSLAGCPRFGFLLEAGSGPVGVSLMLYDGVAAGDSLTLRCNLSSWTVDPAFRMQAPLLVASALKRRDVTYTNISPAPHTWATIEAQGFQAYAWGQYLVVPRLARARERVRVRRDAAAWRDLPEAGLLADHAGYGCHVLTVEAADGLHPFVFQPFRARSGRVPLPLMQLIFCRDIAGVSRFSAALGGALLARGAPGLVMDAPPEPGGPPLLRHVRRGRRYFRGPNPPRLGDLSYTERAIFGA